MTSSIIVKNQKKKFGPVVYKADRGYKMIIATARYDDECGNGHNSFSLTADIYAAYPTKDAAPADVEALKSFAFCQGRDIGGGCCHEKIAEHFPELAPLVKWHLFDSTGPLHYIKNVVFFAGDRDYWGLRKGEFRQHLSRGEYQAGGVEDVPLWELKYPQDQEIYTHDKPLPVTLVLEWQPRGMTGKGKARELDAARRAAVWLDATDEELTAPGLEERLQARLPALLEKFHAAMTSAPLGFTW